MPWPNAKRPEIVKLVNEAWSYESPFPNYENMPESLKNRNVFSGLRINYDENLENLKTILAKYQPDWQVAAKDDGVRYTTDPNVNFSFPEWDAYVLYCLIREIKPQRIIELGSGMSTRVMVQAISDGKLETTVVCVDKYVDKKTQRNLSKLKVKFDLIDINDVDLSVFSNLEPGDILFIDSSHVLSNFSDVELEFMMILPMLKPGVIVQVHDIFLPFNYPLNWLIDWQSVLTEQHVLAAYLHENPKVRILASN